jgi:hypothetical protein
MFKLKKKQQQKTENQAPKQEIKSCAASTEGETNTSTRNPPRLLHRTKWHRQGVQHRTQEHPVRVQKEVRTKSESYFDFFIPLAFTLSGE